MQPAPYELERDLANRIRCCDILELDFDEALVEDFIAIVHELAAVSERIEIILPTSRRSRATTARSSST